MNKYAVIPSGFRLEELTNLVNSLDEQDVDVVVVNTGYKYEDLVKSGIPARTIFYDDVHNPVKNISRWWNLGLESVYKHREFWNLTDEFIVFMLNDDVVIPNNFAEVMTSKMMESGAGLVGPDVFGFGQDILITDQRGTLTAGFCFGLRGSLGLRADENLVWWYGDNDLEWQARALGGSLLIGGLHIQHLYPNSTTIGDLAVQAGKDRETFVAKWGRAPW